MEEKIINLYFKIFPRIIIHYHSYRLKKFINEIVVKYDKKGRKLLDIGAGGCQYKKFFKNLIYKSQDIKNNKQGDIDYIGDVKSISVEDNSFDYILCTQVLEHLKEPHLAFREFARVLKKNGKVFLTTHLAFEEHMVPIDYFRFTRYGLKYLAQSNGFRVEMIIPQGGRFILLGKEIQVLPFRIIKNQYLALLFYFFLSLPLFLLSFILFLLDFLDKEKSLTLAYECIFVKV